MKGKINLVEKRFGRWKVIGEAEPKNERTMWKCKCDCGTVRNVESYALRNGKTLSCGCYRDEKTAKRSSKHNMCETKLYYIYKGMKSRCNNKNVEAYGNYGGRGIGICSEWKDDFNQFLNWAYQNGYDEGLTIDRINNDGNYSPNNCRWVTMKVQQNNRNNNVKPVIDRREYKIKELSQETGINENTLYKRFQKGWRDKKLIQPVWPR